MSTKNAYTLHPEPRSRTKRSLRIVLVMAAFSLLAYGSYGLYQRHSATKPAAAPTAESVVSHSTDTPAESAIDHTGYKTRPDYPRKISLPDINLVGMIQPVGVDQNKAIAAPNNVNLAGWFVDSPKPGEAGVSILDGHVQGRYVPGVFKRLGEAKAGQAMSIEYGDGSIRRFEVVRVMTVPEAEASKAQYQQLDGVSHQLTLITCAGRYDKTTGRYADRTLVYASMI